MYQDIKNIGRVGSVPGWTTGEGCTTQALPIIHGNLSPQRQNYLYFFVVPKVTVNPASTVTLVKSCTDSTIINDPIDPTINLYNSSGNPIGEDTYDSGTKMFSIVNNDGSGVKTELLWNSLYEARLSINVNFIICNSGSPSFTVGTVSTQPNVVNADLPSYPSLTDTENQVKFTFEVAYKNSNNWWQVYNGGAHANGLMNLDRLPNVFVDPNVVKAPVVGKLTDALATQIAPEVIFVSGLNLYYYTPALVSASDPSVINFEDGKAGLPNTNWFAEEMNTKMEAPYTISSFDDIVSNWVSKPNITSGLNSANSDAVYVDENQEHNNSSNKNKYARPIAIDGDFAINTNLLVNTSSESPLIILVNGDVTIGADVETIQATIYATGTITIPTKGDQTDPILNVIGSLIANQFDFKRDLANIKENVGVPSQKIIFDARVISGTSAYPTSMKEANAYWVVTD